VWRRGVCQAKDQVGDRRPGQEYDPRIREAFGNSGRDNQVNPAEGQGGNPDHTHAPDLEKAR
jgi:hypothetical protein